MKSRRITRVFSLLLALFTAAELLSPATLTAAAAQAAEYCWFCKGTYPYTLQYVQWTA